MNTANLAPLAKELASLIGLENTLVLMNNFGGTYLDIPKNPKRASILNKLLPFDAVTTLCTLYGGSRISYIPLNKPNNAARDAEIIELHGKKTLREVSRHYGISIRHVMQIRRKHKQALNTP